MDESGENRNGEKDRKEFLPPLDFGTIVSLLYLPALIHLGVMPNPATGETNERLPLAKRHIDLLDLLKEKTQGNLDEDEAKALDDMLGQLKMIYLQKTQTIKM